MFKIKHIPLRIVRTPYLDGLLKAVKFNNRQEFAERTKEIRRHLHISEEFTRDLIPGPDELILFKVCQSLAHDRAIRESIRNLRRSTYEGYGMPVIEPFIEAEFGPDDSNENTEALITAVWEKGEPL